MKITKKNTKDFITIIIVFALTGFTTVYCSSLITDFFGLEKWSLSYIVVYVFLIFPTYHLLLLGYAFLFGKFDFFWRRIKKIISKISSRIP
ncbi:MAG: diacylglyceryl transferase [Ignavibacteria bacterium]|nr:diacylglyceryl transferase [Ignavibacteria bacterium]